MSEAERQRVVFRDKLEHFTDRNNKAFKQSFATSWPPLLLSYSSKLSVCGCFETGLADTFNHRVQVLE
jgi:hypothetical protein